MQCELNMFIYLFVCLFLGGGDRAHIDAKKCLLGALSIYFNVRGWAVGAAVPDPHTSPKLSGIPP